MKLSSLQQEILDNTDYRSVVIASAASGKTRLLTEKARQILRSGVDPKQIAIITFTNMAASELIKRLGSDYKGGVFVGTIHSLANSLLTAGNINTFEVLEREKFDKLFTMVEDNPKVLRPFEWVLLDEGQDSDELQFRFLFEMINPTRFFVCADPKQCQPTGTKVYMANGLSKNIEDIKVGDKVLVNRGGVGKTVLGTAARVYEGEPLINIKTFQGHNPIYTPNHRTYARFLPDIDKGFISYAYESRCGTKGLGAAKFSDLTENWKFFEGKVWLVGYSTNYYVLHNFIKTIDKAIKEKSHTFESFLEAQDLSYQYPMFTLTEGTHFPRQAEVFELTAANLNPQLMDVVAFTSNKNISPFLPFLKTVTTSSSGTVVHSLEVEGGLYISEGIVTHNSIYKWKGANPSLIFELEDHYGAQIFDLNENYRNQSAILSYAKKLISPTGLQDNSIPMRTDGRGVVTEVPFDLEDIVKRIAISDDYKNWAILTRTNSEIDLIGNFLTKRSIPYLSFRQGDLTNEELYKKMEENKVKVLTVHSAKGLEWDNVIVVGLRYRPDEERNVCYVAATRARNNLIWMYYIKGQMKKPKTYGLKTKPTKPNIPPKMYDW